ncbi:Glycosyltransferase involved in cell wall bisynthesis [Chryseobacterium arachidis]|uniref:Glycosyltransferase involved in cell wall bisynthesis n=2 Tax=Chryseobacterium arachidis TaxID=1416778 RepID=A0A1M5M986_9FLAO|nr:glycosyltransferase family 4 protein [Chryseobacterium arachidis]SHG73313.1 Glycosyltransferase involved in cell wall bisynthesis [Chryseobacterium arachidis]
MEQIKKRSVLIVTQNFYPENFKSNDVAFELKKKGYDVTVLTGIPNYPQGKYYPGYGLFKKRVETVEGIKVYRCLQIPRGKKYTKFLLPSTYLSFMFFGSLWAIYLSLFKKFDSIFVHQVSPITQTLPAIIVKKMQKKPLILWVLDLWPDAFISGSGIDNKTIILWLGKYVDFSYKNSDKILISSKGFKESIVERIGDDHKIQYFPNWAEDTFQGAVKHTIPSLPDGFKIMLAGNLGVSQNLENIMYAALKLKNENVRWIILGDGSRKEWMENFVKENSLQDSVFLMGKHPVETMPAFYENADIMLLSLNNKYDDLKKVVPARLQSYMAAGKPVLGFIEGAATDVIKEADCGYTVNPDDIDGLVDLIQNKLVQNSHQLPLLGSNGKTYFDTYFTKQKCINNLIAAMDTLN